MKRLSNMEKAIIENRAEKVLEAFGYGDENYANGVYVDAIKLARFFGFSVNETNKLPDIEDGCIRVTKDAKEKSILVNENRSFETKRFTIVHELSHYLLHYTGKNDLFAHREDIKGKDLEENDADYMAACLLMPKDSFKKQYDLIKKDKSVDMAAKLHDIFKTNPESISRRISEVC